MAHQSHIKSEKYRQWVKAGLGLGYLKEGLAPFCDEVAKQQHNDILDNIKLTKNVPSVLCGRCTLKTLQPDHVKLGNKQCPLRHVDCNCCYTSGKTPCPNNVCGAIYDSILTYHASTPPVPNWKNTQTQQWLTDPWSIAKCFINAPGYEQKTSAADTDCTGLLHVIINNKYFHNHVICNMSGPNIFSKVRQYRNEIFHSSNMELDSPKTNSYLDDMIAVLQDGKKLVHRQDAKEAVNKLQDLKNEDFVITTTGVELVLREIREEMGFMKITMESTKEDCEDLKRNVDTLETNISELKEVIIYLKEDSSKIKTDFATLKADLREKLRKEYRQNLLQVPAMPCQQEHLCDFKDVYVKPRITIKSKNKDGQKTETIVKRMSDIFNKDDKPLKSIYILGEAGSGKSCFCKSLVQSWCMATQNQDGQQGRENTEDIVDSFKVMKDFYFLFFLPLRHCTDTISINDMLEEEYGHPVLKELLQRESETCLIVLDGLDEWTSRTLSPPKRAKFCNYTVLTTSRPWKIGSLGISDKDMQQNIYINGFGSISKNNIITKTVNILNKTFKKDKDPRNCKDALKNESFISLSNTAMMLQQLICLWFDNRLIATCKCSIYTNMLDLFFVWYKKKVQDAPLFNDMLKKSHGLQLPEYLNNTAECKSYSYIIQGASRLAYGTLIKNKKETSLSFESAMFQQLGISDDIKECCLILGILSEEKGPSLSASRSRKSHISFIHKSVQEYLAAVYIVLNIEQESLLDKEGAELSVYLSKMFEIKTLDELLEQENVLILMCGLEPGVAKTISKFINDIVVSDERVLNYRTSIDDKNRQFLLAQYIQKMILNCIEETKARNKINKLSFHLLDLTVNRDQDIGRLFSGVHDQNLTLDSALSLRVALYITHEQYDVRIFDCMSKCTNLEAIDINFDFDEKFNQRIFDSIEANASTLKCLSVRYMSGLLGFLRKPTFRRIANMHISNASRLAALQLANFAVTHEDFTSLCTFLSRTGQLQQISITIKCDCNQQHEVDLSKHKHLQHLEYSTPVIMKNADCTNLETINCFSLNKKQYIHVLDFLTYSMELKEITLSQSELSESVGDPSKLPITVTQKMITVIMSSQQLRELTLEDFTLTDNIIGCPLQMKSMESIKLIGVTMSLTTWRKFVDSVAELPQPVKVEAHVVCITPDGEECNPDIKCWKRGGGNEAAALQYVKGHKALFDVSYPDHLTRSIDFQLRSDNL